MSTSTSRRGRAKAQTPKPPVGSEPPAPATAPVRTRAKARVAFDARNPEHTGMLHGSVSDDDSMVPTGPTTPSPTQGSEPAPKTSRKRKTKLPTTPPLRPKTTIPILFGDDEDIDPAELDEKGNIKDLIDYSDEKDYARYEHQMKLRDRKERKMASKAHIVFAQTGPDDAAEGSESEEDDDEDVEDGEEPMGILIPYLMGEQMSDPLSQLQARVMTSNLPMVCKESVLKRLENADPDKPKLVEWIESLLSIPFGRLAITPVTMADQPEKIKTFFDEVIRNFDQQVYGLRDVKQQIIDYLAQFIAAGPDSCPRVLALWGVAGVGKCLAPDTPVLTWPRADIKATTPRVKLAREIVVGDLLVGDDSQPRTVLSVCSGTDPMYRIRQGHGDSYVVNEPHILSLKISGHKSYSWSEANSRFTLTYFEPTTRQIKRRKFTVGPGSPGRPGYLTQADAEAALLTKAATISDNDVLDISVGDYLKLNRATKHMLKGFKVGVNWPSKPVFIEPYLLGCWLGDGGSNGATFTNMDTLCLDEVKAQLSNIHCELTPCKGRPDFEFRITGTVKWHNDFRSELRAYGLLNDKHIPADFIYNNRSTRLQVLAGLIDTDGYYGERQGGYEIVQKNRRLAEDILFLVRSLGFRATLTEVEKTCTNAPGGPVTGTYWKCWFSGEGLENIPCRIERKRARLRRQKKDALVCGIEVEAVGRGEYCGFTLDGNHRFLLGDFSVTHNTFLVRHGIADVLGRPLRCINMGGIKDSVHMCGFDYSYSNARYGVIVQTLIEKQVMNPIILFEEVDKISETRDGQDIQNVLMHLTDPEQNRAFQDKYFTGIDIDMSKAILVFTLNDPTLLSPILLNRLHLVKVPEPSRQDKIEIARRHMVPDIFKNVGMDLNSVQIPTEVYGHILERYSQADKGLRTLKRCLETIVLRLNTIRLMGSDLSGKMHASFPMTLTSEIADSILSLPERNEAWSSMIM